MNNKAHVFQHPYTGVQIFVYHKNSKDLAYSEFSSLVFDADIWVYLGEKVAFDTSYYYE